MSIRIKICGLTNERDAEFAVEAGADCVGFVLYPKSPRCVDEARIRRMVDVLPPDTVTVGVFVNCDPAEVERITAACGLNVAQLHGSEPPDHARRLGRERVWKAFQLRTPQDVAAAAEFPAAAIVADAAPPGQWGGAGQVGDWGLAAELAERRPLVLAGGLTPDNVGAAIDRVKPSAVDVSSGVESAPGKKDHKLIQAFIAAARAAAD